MGKEFKETVAPSVTEHERTTLRKILDVAIAGRKKFRLDADTEAITEAEAKTRFFGVRNIGSANATVTIAAGDLYSDTGATLSSISVVIPAGETFYHDGITSVTQSGAGVVLVLGY